MARKTRLADHRSIVFGHDERDGFGRDMEQLAQYRARPGRRGPSSEQLSWAIAEGMVFAAQAGIGPRGVDRAAVADYARRHGLDPSSVGAHLVGRAAALRAVRRELAALQAEADAADARSVLDRAFMRAERLMKEVGADATVMARVQG